MLETLSFLLFYLLALSPLWRKPEDSSLTAMLPWVARGQSALLTKPGFLLHVPQDAPHDLQFVQKLCQKAYFSGQGLDAAFGDFYAYLLHAQAWLKLRWRYQLFFVSRLGFCIGFALMGRSLFCLLSSWGFLPAWSKVLDYWLALLCGLLLAASANCFPKRFPHHWFWHQGLTPQGKSWLQARLLGLGQGLGEWEKIWQELDQQERLTGSCRELQRGQLLELWLQDNTLKQQQKKYAFEELLPLWEFALGGLTSLLMLFSPLYACWQYYQLQVG